MSQYHSSEIPVLVCSTAWWWFDIFLGPQCPWKQEYEREKQDDYPETE